MKLWVFEWVTEPSQSLGINRLPVPLRLKSKFSFRENNIILSRSLPANIYKIYQKKFAKINKFLTFDNYNKGKSCQQHVKQRECFRKIEWPDIFADFGGNKIFERVMWFSRNFREMKSFAQTKFAKFRQTRRTFAKFCVSVSTLRVSSYVLELTWSSRKCEPKREVSAEQDETKQK